MNELELESGRREKQQDPETVYVGLDRRLSSWPR